LGKLIAAAATAGVLATPTSASASVTIPKFWRALAQCETGGRWNWGEFRRPNEGPTYQGGLGFYSGTWSEWRRALGVRYRYAWQAPPTVQVRVAAWGLAHGGYWGCLRGVPTSSYPRWSPPWIDVGWLSVV